MQLSALFHGFSGVRGKINHYHKTGESEQETIELNEMMPFFAISLQFCGNTSIWSPIKQLSRLNIGSLCKVLFKKNKTKFWHIQFSVQKDITSLMVDWGAYWAANLRDLYLYICSNMAHNKIYNISRPFKKAAGYSSSSITDEAYTLLWALYWNCRLWLSQNLAEHLSCFLGL